MYAVTTSADRVANRLWRILTNHAHSRSIFYFIVPHYTPALGFGSSILLQCILLHIRNKATSTQLESPLTVITPAVNLLPPRIHVSTASLSRHPLDTARVLFPTHCYHLTDTLLVSSIWDTLLFSPPPLLPLALSPYLCTLTDVVPCSSLSRCQSVVQYPIKLQTWN